MKERKGSNRRLHFILDKVSEQPSITREEIDAMLNQRKKWGEMADERGRESVVNTVEVLISQEEITQIAETERYGKHDRNGRDLQVFFDKNLGWPYHLESVWVQVKSSDRGVDGFIQEHGKDYLLDNRIVVVNGKQTEDEILQNFWDQVNTIYHRRNNH